MAPLRVCAALALISAASAAAVFRQTVPALGGPEVPEAERVCSKSGEKCAGAAGQPNVVFKACCDERLTCGTPKDLPSGLWGQFCITQEMSIATTTAPATTAADGATTAAGDAATTAAAVVTDENGSTVTSVVTTAAVVTDADGNTVTTATDEDDTTATPTPDDDGSVCFPADATVELADGSIVPMSEVSIGDAVKVGVNRFSKVFMFTHKMADVVHNFVTLKTASGAELALTKGHYIYADGALVAASQVSVGASVTLGNGDVDTVVSVGSKSAPGLYNPQTVDGDVVVNGVVSSTYTTAVEPRFAHAILAPFRFFNSLGLSFTALESGGGVLADVAPRGQAAF